MTSFLLCAMLAAGAAPVPLDHVAPAPRLVKPDISLILLERVADAEESRVHVTRVGFRNGKTLPPELVWEGSREFIHLLTWPEIVAGRFLVTSWGGVIDLRENKLLSSEQGGLTVRIEDTKVIYTVQGKNRVEGLFQFEYSTGRLTRLGNLPAQPWYDKVPSGRALSADDKKAVSWAKEELVLYREGEEPKSLGKGFKMERERGKPLPFGPPGFMWFPVLWLDNETFLTQRANGKLVVVDLNGKVTDVAAIKEAARPGWASFSKDASGAIIYSIGEDYYRVDLAKKTATKTEWENFGHGFEISYKSDKKLGQKVRYQGKEIGQFRCYEFNAKTAPGYLAIPKDLGVVSLFAPRHIAVWSAATGEWTTLRCQEAAPYPLAGWVK